MSSFYAYDFIFDDIPSQRHDLKIITFEDGGLFNGVGSSDVNIIEQRVLRKSKPYYLGRTQETKLEFPLTFGTASPISALQRDIISTWLFGRSTYKKLYILQDDLNGAYFNCFLTKPEPLYIGGLNYAFQCTVTCDSPWAYSPQIISSGSTPDKGNIQIYNDSSEDEYLYPTVRFKIVSGLDSGLNYPFSVRIMNLNDSGHASVFYALALNDDITVDNDLQIITHNTSGHSFPRTESGNTYYTLLECFNKLWFRLLPKINDIYIIIGKADTGGKVEYQFTYTKRLKIGG